VLPVGMIGEGLRVLGAADGLPALPNSRMGIIHSAGAQSEESKALAEAIRATIGGESRLAA